jgi:ABC-type protease/lipase transport system fused ATPase/permease subunit
LFGTYKARASKERPPNKHDWFNVGAIVPPLVVLFSFSFYLFVGPVMSLQVEVLWVTGIIIIAFLVWLNAAKTEQRGREANAALDEIKQLLAKPGTTLEDVKRAVGVLNATEGADIANFHGTVE